MRRIINGLAYDTATATLVAEYANNLGDRDFNNLEEDLYRTQKGNWFIAGRGGALTSYAESNGNTSTSGEAIRPISSQAALEWLENHEMTSEIEAWFNVVDA